MTAQAHDRPGGYAQRTGWTGWIIFAAVLMVIAGGLNLLYGIVAVVNNTWVVWTNQGNVYLNITHWGWVHIGMGSIVLLAGLGLFTGNIIARFVAVMLATLSIVANFMFIPVFPLWAILVIALDVLVIWAVTAHGREMEPA